MPNQWRLFLYLASHGVDLGSMKNESGKHCRASWPGKWTHWSHQILLVTLNRKHAMVIIILPIFMAFVAYLTWRLGGTGVALIATATVLFFGCSFATLTLYRRVLDALRRVEQRLGSVTVREADNCYRQMEALINVRSELSIRRALPAMRGWAISPDLAEVMLAELKDRSPTHVLECGSGVSTLVIAYFLKRQGRGQVVSLEHDRDHVRKSSQLVAQHGLQAHATVVYAPLVAHDCEGREFLWYDVSAIHGSNCFDFVVVDGPPKDVGPLARWPLLYVVGDRLAAGSAIILDDVSRPDEKEILEQWKESVPDIMISDFRTEKGAAVIQMP